MSTKKKHTSGTTAKKPRATPPPPPSFDIEALLVLGEEQLRFDFNENDNVYFMADLIDPM